jgi:hypothetical protein
MAFNISGTLLAKKDLPVCDERINFPLQDNPHDEDLTNETFFLNTTIHPKRNQLQRHSGFIVLDN